MTGQRKAASRQDDGGASAGGQVLVNNRHARKHQKAQAAEPPPEKGTRNQRGRASGKIIIWVLKAVSGQVTGTEDWAAGTNKGRGGKIKGQEGVIYVFIVFWKAWLKCVKLRCVSLD